jgi:hypothetical protein
MSPKRGFAPTPTMAAPNGSFEKNAAGDEIAFTPDADKQEVIVRLQRELQTAKKQAVVAFHLSKQQVFKLEKQLKSRDEEMARCKLILNATTSALATSNADTHGYEDRIQGLFRKKKSLEQDNDALEARDKNRLATIQQLRSELVKAKTTQQEEQLIKSTTATEELYNVQLHLEEVKHEMQEFAELLESFEAWFWGLRCNKHRIVADQKGKNKSQRNTLVVLESTITALKQLVEDHVPPELPNGAVKKTLDGSLARSAMADSAREEQNEEEEEEGKQKEPTARRPSQAGLLEGVVRKKRTSTWSRVSDVLFVSDFAMDEKEPLDELNALNRLDDQITKWEEDAAPMIKRQSIFDESIRRSILSVMEQLNEADGVGE